MSPSPFLDPLLPLPAPADDRYIWAKVTQSSPLRIQVDGDRTPLPITPDDLSGGHRPVDQRVYCQILNRRLVVLGPTMDLTPPGVILEFAGSVAPAGYLMADGAAVSRTTYARLYAALGGASSPWGQGNGTTTFNVPNRKGRVAVGRDSAQTEFTPLGKTGGAKTVTLAEENMPAHSHSFSASTSSNSHNHGVGGEGRFMTTNRSTDFADRAAPTGTSGAAYVPAYAGDGSQNVASESVTASDSHSHTVSGTTGSKGSGTALSNLQPYVVVNYIIKT